MLRFIRNFFFPENPRPSHQVPVQIPETYNTSPNPEVVQEEVEANRKRKASDLDKSFNSAAKSKRNRLSAENQGTWNLDIEQADFKFSRHTLAIFAGTAGNTSLISRQCCAIQARRSFHQSSLTANNSSASSRLGYSQQRQRREQIWHTVGVADNSGAASGPAQSVLGQITNLPEYYSPPVDPFPLQASRQNQPLQTAASALPVQLQAGSAQQQQQQNCIHSTPLITAMASSSRSDKARKTASTVPKSSAAVAAAISATPAAPSRLRDADIEGTQQDPEDDDCVITSIEEPKSVADILSPCRFLSPDWLNDIKTSSQSLKSYMQRVETEESLKLQYWARRREADERDLVARVTRNLKLAERELPVLPYRYEEPPPTPPIEEIEEEECPDLTESQLQLVDDAWSRQLPGAEVLAEGFSLRVTREELRSLAGLNWLNDNIVNFYMQLIVARSADPKAGLPKVHAFSTFFYTKLSSSGYASVRRWTRKVDIFSCDVLLCPVHLHNNHWTLCIVDLRSRHIIYLDSLSMGGGASCLPLMRQYLSDEHRDKKSGAELPDLTDYQLVRETGAPQQENGSDCGVFTCKFADYYCKQREFTFSQANMPYFRKRMTLEIIEKRLLW